mmetsp:Transcript_125124/g.400768  ORF Transcript_125124/g.400768 Transcript_125124/m.400768 type:complete len:217 (-) Transcript_125124:61-711(-)
MEMTSSDVPRASRMSRPASSTSAGTTRNPPPAPTRPVTTPTTKPSRIMRHRGCSCFSASTKLASGTTNLPFSSAELSSSASAAAGFWLPQSMANEVAMAMSAKRISNTRPDRKPAQMPPKNEPAMPDKPKMAPILQATFPARACATSAARLVMPTTTSDMAMAFLGSTPSTYTKIGTVKMEPPPPSNPRDTPMKKDSTTANTYMFEGIERFATTIV